MCSQKTPKGEPDSLSRTIGHYASSLVVRQLLGILNAYLKPLLLTPALYGLWNLLNTVLLFADVLHLGARSAMRYRIAQNDARGDETASRDIMGAVFYGTLILYSSAIFALCAGAWFSQTATEQRWGLLALALIIALNWFSDFKIELLKARSRFAPITNSNYISAITGSILNVVLILLFGFHGLLLALILTHGAVLGYLVFNGERFTLARFRLVIFIDLVREGFPIITFALSALLMRTFDRFIISVTLGLEALGYYSIAVMVLGFLMNVPDASREVVEPRLIRELQMRPLEDCVRDYVQRPLMMTAYLMPLVIGPAMLLLPPAVDLLLPNYSRAVLAAQILTAGSLFMALTLVLRGLIIARGMQAKAAAIMLGVVLLNGTSSAALIWFGLGISGVALSSSISFLILFIALWTLLRYRVPGLPRLNWIALFGPLLIVVMITGIFSVVVEWLRWAPWLAALAGLALLMPTMIKIYNHAGQQNGYWRPITWSAIVRKISKSS